MNISSKFTHNNKYFSIVYVRLKCMLTFSLNKKNFQDKANTKDDDEAKKHKIQN
jgi:hypothetical protein